MLGAPPPPWSPDIHLGQDEYSSDAASMVVSCIWFPKLCLLSMFCFVTVDKHEFFKMKGFPHVDLQLCCHSGAGVATFLSPTMQPGSVTKPRNQQIWQIRRNFCAHWGQKAEGCWIFSIRKLILPKRPKTLNF